MISRITPPPSPPPTDVMLHGKSDYRSGWDDVMTRACIRERRNPDSQRRRCDYGSRGQSEMISGF